MGRYGILHGFGPGKERPARPPKDLEAGLIKCAAARRDAALYKKKKIKERNTMPVPGHLKSLTTWRAACTGLLPHTWEIPR